MEDEVFLTPLLVLLTKLRIIVSFPPIQMPVNTRGSLAVIFGDESKNIDKVLCEESASLVKLIRFWVCVAESGQMRIRISVCCWG